MSRIGATVVFLVLLAFTPSVAARVDSVVVAPTSVEYNEPLAISVRNTTGGLVGDVVVRMSNGTSVYYANITGATGQPEASTVWLTNPGARAGTWAVEASDASQATFPPARTSFQVELHPPEILAYTINGAASANLSWPNSVLTFWLQERDFKWPIQAAASVLSAEATYGPFPLERIGSPGALSNFSYSATVGTLGIPPGTYGIRFEATDTANLTSQRVLPMGALHVVDNTPPRITSIVVTPIPAELLSPGGFAAKVRDDFRIKNVTASFRSPNGTTLPPIPLDAYIIDERGNGEYRVAPTAFVPDRLGNWDMRVTTSDTGGLTTLDVRKFLVQDTRPPTIQSLETNAPVRHPDTLEKGDELILRARVDDVSLRQVIAQVTFPTGRNFAFAMNVTTPGTWETAHRFDQVGIYTFKVEALDDSGNQAISGTKEFLVVDNVPPQLSLLNPNDNGGGLSSTNISILVRDSNLDLDSIDLRVWTRDRAWEEAPPLPSSWYSIASGTPGFRLSYRTPPLSADSPVHIRLAAADLSDFESVAFWNYTVDGHVPTSGAFLDGPYYEPPGDLPSYVTWDRTLLGIQSIDDVSRSENLDVFYRVESVGQSGGAFRYPPLGYATYEGPFKLSAIGLGVGDGLYRLSFFARDEAGNEEAESTVLYRVYDARPVVSGATDGYGLRVSAVDPEIPLRNVTGFSYACGRWQTVPMQAERNSTFYRGQFPCEEARGTIGRYYVTAANELGTMGSLGTRPFPITFTYPNHAPVMRLDETQPLVLSSNVFLNWSAPDLDEDEVTSRAFLHRNPGDTGVLLLSVNGTYGVLSFDTQTFPDGMYWLRLAASDHDLEFERLVRVRIDNNPASDIVGASVEPRWAREGQPVTLRVAVQQPIENATAIVLADGAPYSWVEMRDDGSGVDLLARDGVYSGQWTSDVRHEYQVLFNVSYGPGFSEEYLSTQGLHVAAAPVVAAVEHPLELWILALATVFVVAAILVYRRLLDRFSKGAAKNEKAKTAFPPPATQATDAANPVEAGPTPIASRRQRIFGATIAAAALILVSAGLVLTADASWTSLGLWTLVGFEGLALLVGTATFSQALWGIPKHFPLRRIKGAAGEGPLIAPRRAPLRFNCRNCGAVHEVPDSGRRPLMIACLTCSVSSEILDPPELVADE